jgi:hypothetical protein
MVKTKPSAPTTPELSVIPPRLLSRKSNAVLKPFARLSCVVVNAPPRPSLVVLTNRSTVPSAVVVAVAEPVRVSSLVVLKFVNTTDCALADPAIANPSSAATPLRT